MLSKNEIKLISSLQQKKYRLRTGFFIAEGVKVVNECIDADLKIQNIYALDTYNCPDNTIDVKRISKAELKKISTLTTPNETLAIVEIPTIEDTKHSGIILALDGVRDPGNLGTIIRLCDWFGIKTLVCSKDTVDCYNSKVVQASMGSIARVQCQYVDLKKFIDQTEMHVFLTTLDGNNLYKLEKPKEAVVVMGSESHGISKELLGFKHTSVTIPQVGQNSPVDSLNVATATAIVLNEFCRP